MDQDRGRLRRGDPRSSGAPRPLGICLGTELSTPASLKSLSEGW